MDFRRKVLPAVLAAAFIGAALISPIASAAEVNKALAADPVAAMAAIESMQLTPLSDEAAGKIRGEGYQLIGAYIYLGYVRVATIIAGRPTPVVPMGSAAWTTLMYWWNYGGGSTGGGGSW